MRVDGFNIYHVSLPFERPFTTGIHVFTKLENVLIEVKADGLTGIGYVFCFNTNEARAIKILMQELADGLLGEDASNVRYHWEKMWRKINFIGQGGLPVMAVAAIDTALWDLLSQKAGLPLYKVLGAVRNEIPVYATGGWLSFTNDELVAEAVKLKEQGHTHYKIKIGQPDWKKDVERVRLLRENVGDDFEIMVDVNQAWSVEDAIRAGREFERYNVFWYEEPVYIQNVEGSARIAAELDVPIATGETIYNRHSFLRFIREKAADILMPNLARSGGPTEFMQIAALADAHHVPISSHTFTEVSAHLMAACPNGLIAECIPGWWDDLFEGAPKVENGQIRLTDKPGLGFTFSKEAIARYAID